jgi:hypothetical protein
MSLPYTILGEYTGSVQSASVLSVQDTSLLYVSQSADVWFGLSTNDVIEIGTYSTDDQTLVKWGTIDQDKTLKTVTLTYLNNLNIPVSYSYNQLVNPFTLYKNNSILFQPSSDLNGIGITSGNYVVSYNFVRQMAGNPSASLTIKDISPSRTEIKLIPSDTFDIEYSSFCVKKFPVSDVSPVLISITKNFPYDAIYEEMSSLNRYQNGISFLKFVFFLNDDASVINLLRNMYEDYIRYTFTTPTPSTVTQPVTIKRIQGIRTYYSNYLLQNYNLIADFNDLEQQYISFVNTRLNEQFGQILNSQDQGYKDARQFCYDFFVTYFYNVRVDPLQLSYEDKYFGYLKNVLNFGNNKYYSILIHDYLDERINLTDPLTLIVKLSAALPSDIAIKDTCWVSNFSMVPYIFTAILQSPVQYQTITISPPNFGATQNFISKEGSNTLYSANDLSYPSAVKSSITINKKIAELNTDYTKYNNFIIFSSAQNRLNIFQNKMIQWTALSSSIVELNNRYNASLSSSIPYQYYYSELGSFTTQSTQLINSFDGFESYLFNTGRYQYNFQSGSFYSASYVSSEYARAGEYDANNRDSLASNIPQYIVDDQKNYSDYMTFLNMIGHHFDNIYIYIAAMPIERQVKNEISSSLPMNTLKEMLYSFGWDVDDIIGSLDLDEVYLNSMDSASYNALSSQQRLQTIWNRILVNLPGIYKTKGTEECVDYLLSCYGLPSSMLTIREYGGTDYASDTAPTYELDEKTYMLQFSGVGDYVEGPIPYSTMTTEFKFSIGSDPKNIYYPNFQFFPLFTSIPYPYSSSANFNWALGFYRVPGQYTGKVVFQMGSGSSGVNITSSVLPIFNGDIFSVMLRRNYPNDLFDPAIDPNVVPVEYDLTVQRNENGRTIFQSTSSAIFYDSDNDVFSQFGRFRLSNGMFKGTLDKLLIWDVPIDDDDFEEHVNDLNSYGYSGSAPYQHLWVRLNWDYPQNMYYYSGSVWINNESPYYSIPNYYVNGFPYVMPTTPWNQLPTNYSHWYDAWGADNIDDELYSASLNIIAQYWQPYYPTGSVKILAYNFPEAIGNAFSASFVGYPICQWFSQSVYPYQFQELTYQQDIDASKFGPNKYNNTRIRTLSYDLDARLDPFDRSTNNPDITVSGESNQLGFFIDPQDSKNKDILRYVGKSGIMGLIGDPSDLYENKYYGLVNKNYEYNTNGNKRTYFNELLTVYKLYFDKSIFQTIKNVIPARANAYTGVIIEPTLLERPKYKNRPITASLDISYKTPTIIKNIYNFGENLLWADFNTDWTLINSGSPQLQQTTRNSLPPNYSKVIDFKYINDPTEIKPSNMGSGYYSDYMDKIQHSFYPDFELLPRLWETASIGGPLPFNDTVPIHGSVTHETDNGRFMVEPDHGVNYSNFFFSGFNKGNHPIVYYMMKVWDRYYYYSKTGEYIRSDNPADNAYSSASLYLYKYVIFDEHYMRNLVYFTDLVYLPQYDSSSLSYTYNAGVGPSGSYLHRANTFLKTPDQTVSNILASANSLTPIIKTIFNLSINPVSQYFELASGYPRNHYSHKRQQFSKTKYGTYNQGIFIKGQETSNSTINSNGVNDGSLPIQSTNVSNVNVVNASNVIQTVPSSTVGQITPSGGGGVVTKTSITNPGGSGGHRNRIHQSGRPT